MGPVKEMGFLLKGQYCQGIRDHKRIHLKKIEIN